MTAVTETLEREHELDRIAAALDAAAGRVYGKLGITSRRELATALG